MLDMKNNKILQLIIVLAVLIAVGYMFRGGFFGVSEKVVPENFDKSNEVSDKQATSTDDKILQGIMDEGIKSDTFDKLPYQSGIKPPKIATTSYSVYIGFASEVGTSSAGLMNKEVNEAVIGYEWEALPNSQLFASVVLPTWDDSKDGDRNEYEVFTYNEEKESYESLGKFPKEIEIDFPRDGLIGPSRFRVTGISPDLLICPGDRSFNWDIRFTFDGQPGLVRTPITQKLLFWQKCKMR